MIRKRKKLISRLLVLTMVFSFILNTPTNALADSIQIATGFGMPMGLVVTDDGSIYVADYNNNAVKRIEAGGNNITTLGSGIRNPVSIAVSGGAIYVADYGNNKIKRMDLEGNNIFEISGTFQRPAGIALDNSGNIYVACWSTGELKKISADESVVTTIKSGLYSPVGVAVASGGAIYITQQGSGIYKMDSDGGNIARIWSGSSNLLTLDSAGDIYAATGNTIIKIDKDNNHATTLAITASNAWGVALDKEGNVYYTDGSSVRKITSSAATTDSTHIQLTWKNTFEGSVADPAAFIVQGVTTNPTVTEAMVSGNVLTLTLSSPIYINDNITIDYTATGTNDLTSIAEVSNFTNYPVANTVTVTDVASITVDGVNGATSVMRGNSLQMNVSVLPSEATDLTVTWSVVNGTGTATISTDGLLRGTGEGIVTVYATANDNSGVYGTKEIRITSQNTSTPPATSFIPEKNNDLIHIELSKEDINNSKEQIILPVPIEELKERLSDSEISNVGISIQLPEELEQSTQVPGLILKAEVLEAVKASGKDLSVTVKDKDGKERYTWTFTGSKSASSDQELSEFNLYMGLNTLTDEAEMQKTLNSDGATVGLVFNFAHEGLLPFQSRIKIYVGDQQGCSTGSKIYLYHYNHDTGKLETLPYSSNYLVDEEGYITVDLIHCSDYVALLSVANAKMYTSLRKQIKVTAHKEILYLGDNKEASTEISVELPATLELVSSLQEATSQSGIGGVRATYSSSDEKVAVVDSNGRILAVGVGKTLITTTLKLYSGKIKTVKTAITVKEPYIKISHKTTSMKVGDTYTFEGIGFGVNTQDIQWRTTKKSIVVINLKTGKATAKTKGTEYVVARIGNVIEKVKIEVK